MEFLKDGTITSPQGFFAGAVKTEKFGLGLLYSQVPCSAAGLFTQNQIKAAPVLLSQKHLQNHRAQAVAVNRGCANACTGGKGLADAEKMAYLAAEKLGLPPKEVLIASTGIIGMYLPMTQIHQAIKEMEVSSEGAHDFARAILTTDRFSKEVAVTLGVGGKKVVIGGVAKGVGMIHPNMATLLCFLTTDALVEPRFLHKVLKEAVDVSFNMVTIDGDTSPNDSVLLLANGMAGNELLTFSSPETVGFQTALKEVCLELAKLIARDGEGAKKLIEVVVEGAKSSGEARLIARTVASSPLVKAAVHGSDPNWGRVIAALGRSEAKVEESKIELYLNGLCLFRGEPLPFARGEAVKLLEREKISFRIRLNLGQGRATAWGCDLSPEYVNINSAYTT